MIRWRFCGRFDPRVQDAISDPAFTWMDEAEAKRRYTNPGQSLTVIPPTSPHSGLVPYFIVITTGPRPDFVMVRQTPTGLVDSEIWWSSTRDGQLFCRRIVAFDWPIEEPLTPPAFAEWSMRASTTNESDGTFLLKVEHPNRPKIALTHYKISSASKFYSSLPEWSQWQKLAGNLLDIPEELRSIARNRHPEAHEPSHEPCPRKGSSNPVKNPPVGEDPQIHIDSYDDVRREIIGRKYTQLAEIQSHTWRSYLTQLTRSYRPYDAGLIIANTPRNKEKFRSANPKLGTPLAGVHVLEVPAQHEPPPVEYLRDAKKNDVTVRDIQGTEWHVSDDEVHILEVDVSGKITRHSISD